MEQRQYSLRHFVRFALQVIKGRWTVVVVSFFVMACSGATYIFSVYSNSIKSALQYDQTTIDTLSFFKDLGANVGIISGLLNEILPPWVVLAVGAGMNMFGYLMIWLAVTHRITRPPKWQMYLYMTVGANSQTFANTGVLVTCVKNFPQSRGVVLGLLKGFVGLSGAIFTQLYHAVYGQDARGVILLVGWLPSLVSLLFMFVVRPMKPEMDKNEGKHFFSFLYLALGLATFLMLIIVLENELHFTSTTYKIMGFVTAMFLLGNVIIGLRAELERLEEQGDALRSEKYFRNLEMERKKGSHGAPSTDGQAPAYMAISSPQASGGKSVPRQVSMDGDCKEKDDTAGKRQSTFPRERAIIPAAKEGDKGTMPAASVSESSVYARITRGCYRSKVEAFFSNWPKRGEDFTIPQALLSLDLWILFIAATCGVGATLTAIDNMGQIGSSLGYSQVAINTFVSLISIWNFLGRVIAGFLSEMLLQRYGFPRTFVFTIVLALACVGHIMIAFPRPGMLYIASIIVGLCFGAQWPVLLAVISELFGLKYYATLYNCGAIASPLGSYLLNVRVAGYLYDREAKRQLQLLAREGLMEGIAPSPFGGYYRSSADSSLTCVGEECFRLTFLIMTGVSLFGSLVSFLLVLRTRKFYGRDIYARFRKADSTEQDISAL